MPAWALLWAHSYRVGARWLKGTLETRRVVDPKEGLYRLLVPIEPWRYYELARVAEHDIAGRWLDVGSPKQLASMLNGAGRGRWVAVDLFADEIERWQRLDPDLDLRVEDARTLSFPDATFDGCACISVIEHVASDGDSEAMAEIWRVLRPGGVLHLTTNVADREYDVLTDNAIYGEASEEWGEHPFFERRYTEESLQRRLLSLPWEELEREYAMERLPVFEVFAAGQPWSFVAGGLLALICPWNFRRSRKFPDIASVPRSWGTPGGRAGEHAVVYLRLRKPAAPAG